ncbi:DUF4227 family protein [Paenibacillus validus]|uniref:DUF4227 family protein n=1 Tax=Paenibacillus validus TaxID=44253 RepID=A0A7X2ZB41_9BACL|nr:MULTISPECIES: DUF4227 family protein [Paenibacillus]MED4603456.1 DUF4227 family protein [Paenibacillus validus]MED4608436.1 DUF4227 family protein [Paenibacillus validus]MUG71643.1 DUF4227 family protein [Paenibacillus validus]
MIFHFRIGKWIERLRFGLLFVVFTFALYHLLLIVTQVMEPMPKYKEPVGRAVKVFQSDSAVAVKPEGMGDRLKLFYWIGE